MTDPQRISPETQTASWPPPPGPEPAPPALPRSFRPQKETPPKKSKPTPSILKIRKFSPSQPTRSPPNPRNLHAFPSQPQSIRSKTTITEFKSTNWGKHDQTQTTEKAQLGKGRNGRMDFDWGSSTRGPLGIVCLLRPFCVAFSQFLGCLFGR